MKKNRVIPENFGVTLFFYYSYFSGYSPERIATECPLDIDFSFVRFSMMENAKYYSPNYGYYWYRERISYGEVDTEAIFASGNGGQYMMYFDEYDLIVAFTGHAFGN